MATTCASGQGLARGWGGYRFDAALLEAQDFVEVSSGYRHTMARRSDGTVVAWGGAAAVQVPQLPLPATKIATLTTQGLALLTDGSIATWGFNWASYGNLNVPPLPAGVTYVDITTGYLTSAALRSDGQLVAWGDNFYGQNNVPTAPPGVSFTALSSGEDFHMALRSDGQIAAWGRNDLGQTNVPGLPAGMSYTAIDGGGGWGLALRSDGRIITWGYNSSGQLNVPSLPAGMTYLHASAGRRHGLALRSDGNLVTWGNTANGLTNYPPLPAGVTYVEVTCGADHSAARRSDGRIVCWGDNRYMQCNFPVATSGAHPTAIDAAEDHVVVLLDDGTLTGTGPSYGTASLPAPPPGLRYTTVATEFSSMAAVRSDGTAHLSSGTLPALPPGVTYVDADVHYTKAMALRSDGLIEVVSQVPAPPPTLPPGVTYVAIDASFALAALRSDGQVVVWYASPHTVPPPPLGLEYVEVAMGSSHRLARLSDGTVANWGRIASGTAPTRPAPPLPPGVTYVEIAADDYQSVARRSNGTIVAWEHDPAAAASLSGGTVVEEATGIAGLTYNAIGVGKNQTVAVMGPTSTYVTYGVGCAGSRPATRLVPLDTPRIGADLEVRLFDLPVDTALLTSGFSNTSAAFGALPFAATPFGLPGCTVFASADFAVVVAGSGNQAMHTTPIPNNLILLGVTFYHQAIVPDPGANAAGLVLSDAAEAVIGR